MRGELSQAGDVRRPEAPHSTTWTLQAKRSGPPSPAQPGLRTRAGVQASLAQENILHSSGRRGWRTWVTGDVGSSPATSLRRQRGLRSSALRGPVLSPPPTLRSRGLLCTPSAWAPRPATRQQNEWVPKGAARPRPGPAPASWAYRPGRWRRRRRRQRSKEWRWARRRGAALMRAAAPGWKRRGIGCSREDAQGHFVSTLLVTGWEGVRQPSNDGLVDSGW